MTGIAETGEIQASLQQPGEKQLRAFLIVANVNVVERICGWIRRVAKRIYLIAV